MKLAVIAKAFFNKGFNPLAGVINLLLVAYFVVGMLDQCHLQFRKESGKIIPESPSKKV